MKKLLISLIFLAMAASTASAQIFNPQVGINLTSFSTNLLSTNGFEASANAGYQVGALVRTGGDLFFAESGLFYVATSQQYAVTDGNNLELTGQVGKRELQLPLRGGINLGGGGALNIRFAAGPVAGYVLSSNNNPFQITADDYKDINLYGRIGAGVDVLIISIDIDYQFGLNDVFKDGEPFGPSVVFEGDRNNSLMLSAGLRF